MLILRSLITIRQVPIVVNKSATRRYVESPVAAMVVGFVGVGSGVGLGGGSLLIVIQFVLLTVGLVPLVKPIETQYLPSCVKVACLLSV